MAKRPPAVYAPGELDRTRRNLGNLDPEEAKRIASLLGGEIGTERSDVDDAVKARMRNLASTKAVRKGGRAVPSGPGTKRHPRSIESVDADGTPRRGPAGHPKSGPSPKSGTGDHSDDPAMPLKPSYRERVRMDRFASLPEFEIKTNAQVLVSMVSIFGDPPDLVNPRFTTERMNGHFGKLEVLVTAARSLLPRNNPARAERFRLAHPFEFRVVDAIRYWDVERVSSELARLQSHPRDVVAEDYAELLRAVYRPLAVLERLDADRDVREAFRTLYHFVLEETGPESKEKNLASLKDAVAAYAYVSSILRRSLYPLLLKRCSDRWLPYQEFFRLRRRRVDDFLGLGVQDRIPPPVRPDAGGAPSAASLDSQLEALGASAGTEGVVPEPGAPVRDAVGAPEEPTPEESPSGPSDEAVAQPKAPQQSGAGKWRTKAIARSLEAMETLFPEAGWAALPEFPDLYPYFVGVFDFKRGFELVAPNDPVQQVVVLMRILEELFYGLRFIEFGTVTAADGSHERVDQSITRIIDYWHSYEEEVIAKDYLPRLQEYVRSIDNSGDAMASKFSRRALSELNWTKKLYFLPFLDFESDLSTHPFKGKELPPLYEAVRELRSLLTAVAQGIDAGVRKGGAAAGAACAGIDNPWDSYVFQVPNPVSQRMDVLLGGKGGKRKTNAALLFFALSAATVLDGIVNDPSGIAYQTPAPCPFRSVSGEGRIPQFGVNVNIDADAIFRNHTKPQAKA